MFSFSTGTNQTIHNDINMCYISEQPDMYTKDEVVEPLKIDVENIKLETIISKRPYYQCITCSATFTKVDYLKDHETTHEGENLLQLNI